MTNSELHHDEIDRILPWYANETLDDYDRRQVAAHLEDCAECRDSLVLLMQMKTAVNDHQPVAMVPEPDPARLLQEIDELEDSAPARNYSQPWLIAASLAIIGIAAVLLLANLPGDRPEPEFVTVTSSPGPDAVGYVFDITLSPDMTAVERTELLSELDATLIRETDPGAVQIVIPMMAISVTELEAFTEQLIRRPGVAGANVVALQLPVQQDN